MARRWRLLLALIAGTALAGTRHGARRDRGGDFDRRSDGFQLKCPVSGSMVVGKPASLTWRPTGCESPQSRRGAPTRHRTGPGSFEERWPGMTRNKKKGRGEVHGGIWVRVSIGISPRVLLAILSSLALIFGGILTIST